MFLICNKIFFKQFTSVFSFTSRGGQEEVRAIKNESFTNFTFSPDLLNFLDQAPPLHTPFGKYTLQIGAEVVLFQEIRGNITNNLYNLDCTALRLFNVYGPGCTGDNPYATAIASWCDRLKRTSHFGLTVTESKRETWCLLTM